MGAGEGSVTDIKIRNRDKKVDEGPLDTDEEGEREQWGNQCEFFLSCLGYAVGFGNVWRFPYLCYKNGGAVFLIPYVIMLLCAGLPLFFMELALGQYVSLGPNILFPKLAPIAAGLGWAMLVISTLVAVYYNIILAWTLFYTFASFTSVLPWSHCNNTFSSADCTTDLQATNCSNMGLIYYKDSCHETEFLCESFDTKFLNDTHCEYDKIDPLTGNNSVGKIEAVIGRMSASEDYFRNGMLGLGSRADEKTWENMGSLRWELVGCLALAWVIVCLCMIKGVKSSGKVVYFTALFPYVVLIILFIRGIMLDGSELGIKFYFSDIKWETLKDVAVWNDAATQIFYSLGSSFGGLITLASYNKYKNNCMRDAILIGFSNCTTSVFAGFVIFSILGFMAKQLDVEVKDVVTSGSGLAFIAYPAAVAKMPFAPVWALLFFFMLITLGLDSQFTMVETLTTAIFDQFEYLRPKKPLVVVIMCFFLFLCGLSMCLEGGIYMFELFNGYSAGLSVIILATSEIIVLQYFYGFDKFMGNITNGMGIYMPSFLYYYWKATWMVITPGLLLFIFGLSLYFWEPVAFGPYVFPENIQGLGWALCASSFVLVPIFAIIMTIKYLYFDKRPWLDLFRHSEKFCPKHERKLMKTRGAALKGEPVGIFRYTNDNEGFVEGDAKVYHNYGLDNSAFQGEAKVYSYGGAMHPSNVGTNETPPPPYNNYI